MSGSDDLGSPISYLALEEGTAVVGSDGDEVGHVAHVLADEEQDIFDGIVIAHGLGRHTFADAEQVAAIHERGVTLTMSAAEADALPEPSENPAVLYDDPADPDGSPLADKLRRAWDLLSGNY
jgi:hypothetical protein